MTECHLILWRSKRADFVLSQMCGNMKSLEALHNFLGYQGSAREIQKDKKAALIKAGILCVGHMPIWPNSNI